MKKKIILSAITSALIISSGVVLAVDASVQDKEQPKTQQTTGRQLMTPEEQSAQRAKMRNATSAEERKEIRKKHHEKMKEKAKEKGMTIPDNPPATPQQAGRPNGGMGGGMGGRMGGGR